ncbi:MAG: hypothetical protein V2I33_23950 [Kangiellaceae bacterium]|jgi:hypothetical protein|nr:hypothetical protein [Kangiellaceae bacterium]
MPDENDISLSFDTEAFATETAKHSALKLKREREKEIRRIRDKSHAFEAEMREKLGVLRD